MKRISIFWVLAVILLSIQSAAFSQGVITRITSYNVCYTKLLRYRNY